MYHTLRGIVSFIWLRTFKRTSIEILDFTNEILEICIKNKFPPSERLSGKHYYLDFMLFNPKITNIKND